jgi:hypothetical protein
MNIEIRIVRENEDGSADCELDMDKEAKELLITEGFLYLVRKFLDEQKPKKRKKNVEL